MRMVVVGATGLLGSELCRQEPNCVPLALPQIDLTDPKSIAPALKDSLPDVVINAAAYTNVDKAESEPDLCNVINRDAVHHLVAACEELECRFVQISTDYVFCDEPDRRIPFAEDDATSAKGVYSEGKLEAENHTRRLPNHVIVRTCGLYGKAGPGTTHANFVDTMIRLGQERDELKVINDQTFTPIYVPYLARAILFLAQHSTTGTYHVVSKGETTWYDMAQEIFRLSGLDVNVLPISTEEWGAPAPRPRYSVLDVSKYESLNGPALPTWQEALAEYLSA